MNPENTFFRALSFSFAPTKPPVLDHPAGKNFAAGVDPLLNTLAKKPAADDSDLPDAAFVETELPVKKSPKSHFWLSLFITIFWNGFLFIPDAGEMFVELITGKRNWFMTIFLSIFFLIGFVALLETIRAAFTVSGPKLKIKTRPVIPTGGSVLATWILSKNAPAGSSLRMTLECVEKITAPDDGGRSVKEKIVEEIVFLNEQKLLGALTGDAVISVPANAPKSEIFQMKKNGDQREIYWQIAAEIKPLLLPKQRWEFKVSVKHPPVIII